MIQEEATTQSDKKLQDSTQEDTPTDPTTQCCEMNKMRSQSDDDDEMPGLFRVSSLRDPPIPPLPIMCTYSFDPKRQTIANVEYVNNYQLQGVIGKGAFGTVYKVQEDKRQYAMKVYSRMTLTKQRFFAADGQFANAMQMLQNELNIVKRLDHRNIAKAKEIIQSNERIYVIGELGDLGTLMHWEQTTQTFQRNQQIISFLSKRYETVDLQSITRIIFIQLCQAILYLHSHNITNRDIKPDNILGCSYAGAGEEIKLIDFTTVRYRGDDDISYFPTGTPGFRAPEHQFASDQGYSCKAADIWGIGMCMYVWLHQILPFLGESQLEMDVKSKNIEVQYNQTICGDILISAMKATLKKEPKERINVNELLEILKGQ